ncbi:Uncharacterised protein [Chlamydia abortus]|nr:Uncharacterised protein [Chlamydia abortus]
MAKRMVFLAVLSVCNTADKAFPPSPGREKYCTFCPCITHSPEDSFLIY